MSLDDLIEKRKEFELLKEKYDISYDELLEKKIISVVKEIEVMQKLYDNESGFVDFQIKAHDFAVRFPTIEGKEDGKFSGETLTNFLNRIFEISKIVTPSAENIFDYALVNIVSGSRVALFDLDVTDNAIGGTDSIDLSKKSFEKVNNVLENINMLTDKATSPMARAVKYKDELELDDKQVYGVMQQVSGLYPSPSSAIEKSDIYINGKKSSQVTINKDDRLAITRSKTEFYQSMNPDNEKVISGTLYILKEWDKERKFVVKDDATGDHVINYSDDEILPVVKNRIGGRVSLLKQRDPDDRRKWIFKKWVD